jgi:hypothetical protein
VVDSIPNLKPFLVAQLGIDTALAATPARYALECGQWGEAAQLPIRDSKFPAAQSITYFARALGAARSGHAAAARAEIARLDEIEAKLTAANDDYWAGQTRIQKVDASDKLWQTASGLLRERAPRPAPAARSRRRSAITARSPSSRRAATAIVHKSHRRGRIWRKTEEGRIRRTSKTIAQRTVN